MKVPLFSVLIANFNNGRFLQEAIDSVLAQTYSNWEIVLVDDHSTDDSFRIYDKYKNDSRFHVFYNETNQGCGYTKRRCVELARGEMCGFLDPDDVLSSNALEVMEEHFRNHPTTVLLFSRFYHCDENLQVQGVSRLLKLDDGKSYLEHGDYCPEHFAAFIREVYLKTNGINPYLRAGVDQDLYFRLEEKGPISVLDELTYYHRNHQDSVSFDEDYALFWNLHVRIDSCLRRNIYIHNQHVIYMGFKDRIVESYQKGKESVCKTYAYRLGFFLLKPFLWMKSVIRM